MSKRNKSLWPSLLIILTLLVAGCAPRAGGGETASAGSEQDLVVDLPAIVIDFNEAGEASIGNAPIAQLAAGFGVPADALAAAKLDPAQIQQLVDANIQHLQITNVPGGLNILVNGQAIPSLGWDGETLTETPEALKLLGQDVGQIEKLLPLITQLGIGVIVRFPVAQGAEVIPTYVTGEASLAAQAETAQADFLAKVGTPGKINIPIFYNADGSFRISDMSGAEFATLTGLPLDNLILHPYTVGKFTELGISKLTLSTDAAGVHIALNDKHLPYISWDGGKLQHALNLAGQAGALGALSDSGMNVSEIMGTVNNLLPVIQSTQFDVQVFFPS